MAYDLKILKRVRENISSTNRKPSEIFGRFSIVIFGWM